jgi:hypothetical protein
VKTGEIYEELQNYEKLHICVSQGKVYERTERFKESRRLMMMMMMMTRLWESSTVASVEVKDLIDMYIRDNQTIGVDETAFEMSINNAKNCLRLNKKYLFMEAGNF